MNSLIKSDELNNRLKYAMHIRNIKSVELSSKTGIDKSQISHYLKGDYKAKQDTLYLMADALNVNPVWLMGYDVPMEKISKNENKQQENTEEYVAEDDAMYPLLDIGDIAYIFKQDTIDETNPSSNNAGTYLIEIDNQRTIRRFIESQDKACYTLQGMNISCRPVNIKKEELKDKITILGKVIRAENKSAFK